MQLGHRVDQGQPKARADLGAGFIKTNEALFHAFKIGLWNARAGIGDAHLQPVLTGIEGGANGQLALADRLGSRFVDTMHAFRPRIIINGVRTAEDVKLGFSIRSVCHKYFGVDADYLGYVNHDAQARHSLRARRPIVDRYPRSDAAIYLSRIARKLCATSSVVATGVRAAATRPTPPRQDPTPRSTARVREMAPNFRSQRPNPGPQS